MKDGINSLVPNEDAELALLQELYKCGDEGETGYIVEQAMAHFPILQESSEFNRETPSGRLWWLGRFRFDLSRLGKEGYAYNVKRGYWRISPKGTAKLKMEGYGVGAEGENEGLTPTEKLLAYWEEHSDGAKAEKCRQMCERILGLLCLSYTGPTKDIRPELWEILDLDELLRISGNLGVTGSSNFENNKDLFPFASEADTGDEASLQLFLALDPGDEGTKAERCQQVCERVFGIFSLLAVEETRQLGEKLWKIIDFNELYKLCGKFGVTGIYGLMDEGDIL